MPATVVLDPPSIQFLFPNGTAFGFSLADLPNLTLAIDLANGLAQLTHPHGTVATHNTAVHYQGSLRKMVFDLSESGFTGGAPDLTKSDMLRYWLANTHSHERNTRRLLSGFDTIGHQLSLELREELQGEKRNIRPRSKPYEPYTEAEWQRLTDLCIGLIDESFTRHKRMLSVAEHGGDPHRDGLTMETVTGWMFRNGPTGAQNLARKWGHPLSKQEQRTASKLLPVGREALFPTHEIQLAYRLLLGIRSGVVADGVDDLLVDAAHWAGDSTVLLDYIKGRSGPESVSLTAPAVRLLEQWLEHSALLRSFALPEQRGHLWISTAPLSVSSSSPIRTVTSRTRANVEFSDSHDLRADDGSRLSIHRGRIRATYLKLLSLRGWTGRTTIDPNHSSAVEGDHYLTASTPAQLDSIESIIEDGQIDMARKALPPKVLTLASLSKLAENFPSAIDRHQIDDTAMLELVGGEQDVFVAACTDQLAGIWGPPGRPCPARPWVCLLCPLAIFVPRHAENLLRLKSFFSRQFRQMPTEQFMKIFGPYAHRLDSEILPLFDPAVLDRAASIIANEQSGLPLRPEEVT